MDRMPIFLHRNRAEESSKRWPEGWEGRRVEYPEVVPQSGMKMFNWLPHG